MNHHSQPGSGKTPLTGLVAKTLIAIALVCVAAVGYRYLRGRGTSVVADKSVSQVVASEELLLQLTPRLKGLNNSAMNLSVPDHHSLGLFADEVQFTDIAPAPGWTTEADAASHDAQTHDSRVSSRAWPLGSEADIARDELSIWRPLFESFEYLDHAKFYFVKGTFKQDRFDQFEAEIGFAATGSTRTGAQRGVHATQTVVWERQDSGSTDAGDWRIVSWQTNHLDAEDSARSLFREVLDVAIPDARQRRAARQSIHEELLTPFLTETKLPVKFYTPYFAPDSLGKHPSVSVVDIDRDGHDDLYVMGRWGKNKLLQNQGDGTFKENAAAWGLDIDGHSTSALFADLDNDGDTDLLLGRSLERSMYLVNDAGKFVDRTAELVDGQLPSLVTAASAADINSDGLLDVYLTTYSMSLLTEQLFGEVSDPSAKPWPDEFLSPEHAEKLRKLMSSAHRILDQVGPPNVMLVNRGDGRLSVESEGPTQIWRSSLQASWADFDDDGDPDVYVANDFAPDNLFRNDGKGNFEDVSSMLGRENMSGGMGASWGDFDSDGKLDVYISNMYSKAGLRIIAQFPDMDERYMRFAEGNRLFRNTGNGFENLAGLSGQSLKVAKAGWSWAGQLFDLDNDTDLDIYVCSGYYTVPARIASGVDL